MRKLMNISIVILVCAISAESFAQTFRVKAGLNLSKVHEKYPDMTYRDDYSIKPGFHLGGTAEYPLSEIFFFETGMFFSTKGYKYEEKIDGYSTNEKLNLYYVDIPLTAKVSIEFGNINVYGFLGPYIGIGLIGKVKTELFVPRLGQNNEETNVEWGSGPHDNYKRLDYGLQVGLGIEKKSIQFGLTYGLGLADISPDPNDENNITDYVPITRNRVVGISIGYKFGRK